MSESICSKRLLSDINSVITPFGADPTERLAHLENLIPSLPTGPSHITSVLKDAGVCAQAIDSSRRIKMVLGQLDVITHAIGVLVALPNILDDNERVLELSLGAGNTGRKFDLVTTKRVAEFKLIVWKGGPEPARQDQLFKDYLGLMWDTSGKIRQIYLDGTTHALKFLQGGRAVNSVLKRYQDIAQKFESRYGSRFKTVGDFFSAHRNEVQILDINEIVLEISDTQTCR